MMQSRVRFSALVSMALVILASVGAGVLQAQEPAGPAGAPPTTGPASNFMQLTEELQKAGNELKDALGPMTNILDPAKRTEMAPKALPVLKRMSDLAEQMAQANPMMAPQAKQMQAQFRVLSATLGDADAQSALETAAKDETNASAKAEVLMVEWLKSNKNPQTQTQILDRAEALAKQHSGSMEVTQMIVGMASIGAADEATEKRAQTIASGMDNRFAASLKAEMAEQAKMESLEDKPLTIAGNTVEGKSFSTDEWKGKVILVDFWATWCGPCLAELPRVKKVYADFHDKGLEIVGVSNDQTGSALKEFMKENPDMPWPQLFDEKSASAGNWHPVTMEYGIQGIPVMFLIDKKGVLRHVDARENFEELIPKLLEE